MASTSFINISSPHRPILLLEGYILREHLIVTPQYHTNHDTNLRLVLTTNTSWFSIPITK